MKIVRNLWLVPLAGMALLISGCHPWFESRFPWEEQPDPEQEPVLTSTGGAYVPGTPSFVSLIDECMSAGGTRGECIEALPPEELAKLEAMEAERGTMRRRQMKMREMLNAGGGYRDFGVARINLPRDWLFSIEQSRSRDPEEVIMARHPDGTGIIYVQSRIFPEPIKREALRNLTNVDPSVQLSFDRWGDYSGYQYEYADNGVFFRQWWLSNDSTMVLVTYQSQVELSGAHAQQVDEIVRSLRQLETSRDPDGDPG